MRRFVIVLAALGLLGLATASAFADDVIVGPTVYTPATTTVTAPGPVVSVQWYGARPYWGGYAPYYYRGYYAGPGYYPGPDYYSYSYPSYVYPGPIYRPYAYPLRAYRFGRVWW
jgi:hypothetical protein